MKELLKRANQCAGAAREIYGKLSRAQKIALLLVTALVGIALSTVAISGSDARYRTVLAEPAGSSGSRRLDDFAARLTRESIPWRDGTTPDGGRAIDVQVSDYKRAKALLDTAGGSAQAGPEWPFQSSSFWESETRFGEKLRDFNRQRIEEAILWNPKIQAARVLLSRSATPRRALDKAGGDSAAVTVHLKEGAPDLLQREADAIRAMVESAFDLEPGRVKVADHLLRTYTDSPPAAGSGSAVEEAGEYWRRQIKEGISEYYAKCFEADEVHVGVIVHVSSEQSSVVSEEIDPGKSFTRPSSTKFEREEGGDGYVGGLMSASGLASEGVPRQVIRESTEEETYLSRKHTLTEIPRGVLRGAGITVLIDQAAMERVLREERKLPRLAPGQDEESGSTLASIPREESEALLAGFVERQEEVLRSFLSTVGELNVKVSVSPFVRSGKRRAVTEDAAAFIAAAPPPPAPLPRGGGWGTALVGGGILACLAACAVAIIRRASLHFSAAEESSTEHGAPSEPASWSDRRLRRTLAPAGILRTVSDVSTLVRDRPQVSASVLRLWLSQDVEEGGMAAGDDGEREGDSEALPAGAMPDAVPGVEGTPATPVNGAPRLTGVRKAAVFILSLDEDVATLLLRSLSDADLGKITAEIADLGVVDKDTVAQVIVEFKEMERLHGMVREGGLEHAVRLVERSFPHERASRIVDLLSEHRQSLPFSFLEGVETETLVPCLADEHPQTLAVVLAHMTPTKAALIVERLDPAVRRDVLERIAGLEGANAEALGDLERSLRKQLDAVRFESIGEGGGVKALAEILRAADGGGRQLLDDLREGRPDLVEEVGRRLFVFDDLVRLDDRALQAVLKEIDVRRLALALKNASPEVCAKVLNNVARRTAEALEAEMDLLGPVRFADVDAARREILETVLRLEEAGDLYISGRGREENRIVY